MRRGRGKVETIALIWAAFSVSPSISDHDRNEREKEQVDKTWRNVVTSTLTSEMRVGLGWGWCVWPVTINVSFCNGKQNWVHIFNKGKDNETMKEIITGQTSQRDASGERGDIARPYINSTCNPFVRENFTNKLFYVLSITEVVVQLLCKTTILAAQSYNNIIRFIHMQRNLFISYMRARVSLTEVQ